MRSEYGDEKQTKGQIVKERFGENSRIEMMDKKEETGKESTDSAGQKNEKNKTAVIPIVRNYTIGEYDQTFVQENDTKQKDSRRKGKDYYDEEEKAEFSNNTGSESNLDSRPSPIEPLVSQKL